MDTLDWHTGLPFTDDYIRCFEKTKDRFEYHPWQRESLEQRASWLDEGRAFGADRERLADVLLRFNESAGNAPEALANVEALRDDRTLVVVGGQQASLFTGPLFVIYKAVTLLAYARQASEQLQRPVIPVYWIAGEDHDFDEVNHLYYLTPELETERIRIQRPGDSRTSVSRTTLPAEIWADAIDQLDKSLVQTEFKAEVMALFRRSAEEALSLTGGFARILAALFGKHGLVLLDSDDSALRELESPMFRTLIERGEAISESLGAGADKLRALGYELQADVQPTSANLFLFGEGDGERAMLYRSLENGEFADRKGERRYSREQLLRWSEEEPGRLSNNVMSRPLMQEFLLPVLATVLGPSEIAYWALTREAFRAVGMRLPIVVPRLSATLIEGTIYKNMNKYDLSLEDVQLRLDERRERWLRGQDVFQLEAKFSEIKEKFRSDYAPLIDTIGKINPGLQKLGETNLSKIVDQIEFLQNKAEDGLKTLNESGLRQFQRIGASLVPEGKPQERVYSIAAYLNRYGQDWLDALLAQPLEMNGKHRVYYL